MRGATARVEFREAAKHERELSDRQQQVLALVAEGFTNAEIGERLGITLDGAKWNVSEILGKLGLATREEAAEYWRWRQGRAWGRVRALLGAPLVKVVGAGAAAVVAIGVVVALMTDDESPVDAEPLLPFYLEASITVWSEALSVGTNVAGGSAHDAPAESTGVIRWWWQDRDHFRWEYEQLSPDQDVLRVIGDGRQQWTVHDPENTYVQQPLPDWPEGIPVRPMTMSVILGPLPLSYDLHGVDGILRWLNDIGEGGRDAKVLREDELLGRRVTIFEMPGGTSGTSRPNPETGATEYVEAKDGRMELWVDVERMMVLKHLLDSDVQAFEAVVTTLEHDADLSAERFVFDIRPESIKLDRTGFGEMASASTDVPAGYLRVKAPLRGYRYRGGGESRSADNEVLSVTMNFYGPNDEPMTVVQERKLFAAELMAGERITVRGREVYASTTDTGGQRLAWEEGSLTVVIEAESATRADLAAMAESMVLVQ